MQIKSTPHGPRPRTTRSSRVATPDHVTPPCATRRRARWARRCRCGRARRRGAHCGVTWSGVATWLQRVVCGRGPWIVDWTCIHGASIDGQFVLVATGFFFFRGHCWGGACIFLARLLVVAWRAVVGGRHWLWTLACCGTNLRLRRFVATSVLRGLPAFYRSSAF